MAQFRDRPTSDLIVIFLTGIVGMVVVVVLIAVMIAQNQGKEVNEGIQWVARLTNTIIGGVFGYLAGRSVTNGNGKNGGSK